MTNELNPTVILRNSKTGLFYCRIGIASAFSAECISEATPVTPAQVEMVKMVFDPTYMQAIETPAAFVLETTAGYFIHMNGKRQTFGTSLAKQFKTLRGAKRFAKKYASIWACTVRVVDAFGEIF